MNRWWRYFPQSGRLAGDARRTSGVVDYATRTLIVETGYTGRPSRNARMPWRPVFEDEARAILTAHLARVDMGLELPWYWRFMRRV